MLRLILFCNLLLLAACGGAPGGPSGSEAAASTSVQQNDSPAPSVAAPDAPASVPDVIEQELAYGATEDTNLVGFFAMPQDVIEPLPGLILVHEWWGLNDDVKATARRLAAEGFAVLAVDLFQGQVAEDSEQASEMLAAAGGSEATIQNISQARAYLTQYALAPAVAAVGWSFGASWVLEAGLALGTELDALVMYYGDVVTDEARLEALDRPLLGHFAEHDDTIPVRNVQAFRAALRDLGKDADVFIYPGTQHAFANPSAGSYDAEAATDAWTKTLAFLDEKLN